MGYKKIILFRERILPLQDYGVLTELSPMLPSGITAPETKTTALWNRFAAIKKPPSRLLLASLGKTKASELLFKESGTIIQIDDINAFSNIPLLLTLPAHIKLLLKTLRFDLLGKDRFLIRINKDAVNGYPEKGKSFSLPLPGILGDTVSTFDYLLFAGHEFFHVVFNHLDRKLTAEFKQRFFSRARYGEFTSKTQERWKTVAQYYRLFKDSEYSSPFSTSKLGHPEDNEQELFASAANIIANSRNRLMDAIAMQDDPEVIDFALETVDFIERYVINNQKVLTLPGEANTSTVQ